MNIASIHESENNQTISDQDSGAEQHQVSLLEKDNDLFSFRKTFASTNNSGKFGKEAESQPETSRESHPNEQLLDDIKINI